MSPARRAIVLLGFLVAGEAGAQTLHEMVVTGPRDKRINLVYLGEGFSWLYQGLFLSYALSSKNEILSSEPFQTYAPYLNFYRIQVNSVQDGSDHPANAADEPYPGTIQTLNTYFNSTFDFGGTHRCIYLPSNGQQTAFTALGNLLPEYDVPFVLVNHSWSGGCAGEFAVFTTSELSPQTSVHEMGHTFANLDDEYETYTSSPGGGLDNRPNTTTQTQRALIKWNHWIDAETPVPTPEDPVLYGDVVGLFRGAHYNPTTWYRPKFVCKMRDSTEPFCEVCREAIVLEIYRRLDPIESFDPPAGTIQVSGPESIPFSVAPMTPATHDLDVLWLVDGAAVPGETGTSFLLDSGTLSQGLHTVAVLVSDPTPFVRSDPQGLLASSRSWTVEQEATTAAADPPDPSAPFLFQSSPNPMSRSTRIRFFAPAGSRTRLVVFDLAGRAARTLLEEEGRGGVTDVAWDGTDDAGRPVAKGVYVVALFADGVRASRKLVVTR